MQDFESSAEFVDICDELGVDKDDVDAAKAARAHKVGEEKWTFNDFANCTPAECLSLVIDDIISRL